MDLYKNINTGKYTNQRKYPDSPTKPSPPAAVHTLTVEQFTEYKEQMVAYERAKQAYKDQKAEYHRGEGEAVERFWADVAEEYGIPPADPFFARMRQVAWEQGHSAGLHDVLVNFDELLPLWELYRDKRPA